MKKLFLPISALMALSVATSAQKARIFAITGDVKGNVNWNSVREIKGSDGSIKSTLYSPSTAAKTTAAIATTAACVSNIRNHCSRVSAAGCHRVVPLSAAVAAVAR